MWLMRALLVILCVSRASAQTCVAGQYSNCASSAFTAGYGGCTTYVPGQANYEWCVPDGACLECCECKPSATLQSHGVCSTWRSQCTSTPCNAGYTGPDGSCTPCAAGTYKSATGSAVCTNCPAGTYSATAGASSATVCTNCLAGTYSATAGASSATVCTNCPAGTYSATAGASSATVCTNCLAGTYSTTAGASSATVCTNCLAGTYSAVAGASACTNCPAGTYLLTAGASSTAACAAVPMDATLRWIGTAAQEFYMANRPYVHYKAKRYQFVGDYLQLLEVGSGQNRHSQAVNGKTRSGSFNPWQLSMSTANAFGAGASFPIVQGGPMNYLTFAENSMTRYFTVCSIARSTQTPPTCGSLQGSGPNGMQSILGMDAYSIPKVKVGGYTLHSNYPQTNVNPTDWLVICIKNDWSNCPSVYYNGIASTFDCKSGNAVEQGNPDNINSPLSGPGTFNLVMQNNYNGGGYEFNQMVSWDRLLTQSEMQLVHSSLVNYKQTGSDEFLCAENLDTQCGSLEYVCNAGYTGPYGGPCIACLFGQYKSQISKEACTNCPAGSFSGVSGASSCQACQANATSSAGSVSQAYCYCKSGYAHVAGSYTCRLCDPGTYNSQLGRTACSNCSVGLYSLNYGAVGNETCLSCPLGQWSPEGSPSCNLCPANSRAAPSSGSLTSCTCDAGYTGPNGGQCSACAAGQYKNATGASACVSCPAGKYSGVTGASNCTTCPSNFTSLSGSSSVSACACGNNLYDENLPVQINCANCQVTGTPRWLNPVMLVGALDGDFANTQAILENPGGITWWRVDLGSSKSILKFNIKFYTGSADGIRVQVGDIDAVDANPSCATIAGDAALANVIQYNVPCTQTGKYLFVRMDANSCRCSGWNCGSCSPFYLHEVQVFSQTTQCSSCPQFSTSEFTGASKSISDCKCQVGYAGANSVCTACVAGKFKNFSGSASCVDCPAGSYSGATNTSACVLCPVGFYSIAGASVCTCAVGQVLVNSACTYNDPALKYWFNFEPVNPNKNSGTSIGDIGNVVTSTTAKRGYTSNEMGTRVSSVAGTFDLPVSRSVSWWLYVSSVPSFYSGILFVLGNVGDVYGYLGTSVFRLLFHDYQGGGYLESPISIYQNTWTHFVYVWDTNRFVLYINGIVKIQTTYAYQTESNNVLQIGSGSETVNWGKTLIDDFRVYSRSLSASEVAWLYNPCEVDAPFYFDKYRCPCGAGTQDVNDVCVACGTGKYAAAGTTACTNCSAGTYSNVAGASSCTNCTAGSYSGASGASSASACVKCPAGKYSGAAGATSASACVSCPAGMSSLEGASVCVCPASTYAVQSSSCVACLANQSAPAQSTAKEACVCNAGYSGPGGSSTLTYFAGATFTDLTSSCGANMNQKCTCASSYPHWRPCVGATDDDNSYNSRFSSYPSACNAGSWACNTFGASSPQPWLRIDFGQVVQVTMIQITIWDWKLQGADVFVGSSTTMTSNALCATNLNVNLNTQIYTDFTCVGSGQYIFIRQGIFPDNIMDIMELQVVGSIPEKNNPCPACAAGTYKNASGSVACTNCSSALYSLSGATVCLNCTDGYFVQSPNAPSRCLFNLTCSACPTDTYHANGTCVACPGNTSAANGSVACQCKAGFTGVADASGNGCDPCPAGTYKRMRGASACRSCPANTGSDAGSALCYCSPGYTGKTGDVCVACVAGTFKNTTGPAACASCAMNRTSVPASLNVTACVCNAGYTQTENAALAFEAVYARACAACDAGKFKNITGVQECTTCAQNQSSVPASTVCTCVAGFTGECVMKPYSSTACEKFISLTNVPSFAAVPKRMNAAVGSASLPKYNASGGPNGKGHVSFDRSQSQYMDAGTQTLNIATNGGLTIVAVVRFTGVTANLERIIDFGNGNGMDNIFVGRMGGGMWVGLFTGSARTVDSAGGGIAQNSWYTITVRYSASSLMWELLINGAGGSGWANNPPLTDRTLSRTYIGRSDLSVSDPFLNADVAGCFVVDEYLSTAAMAAVANAMVTIQGMDLMHVGTCLDCAQGKYKGWLGSQPCTTCPANSYTPGIQSTIVANCTCNIGSTGPNGGPCPACVGGTFKNVTGAGVCSNCSADLFSTFPSAAISCTQCPSGFQSLVASAVDRDCCDPNTTSGKSPFFALSKATQAALGYNYSVRVSSAPLFGLRSMNSTVATVCRTIPYNNIVSPVPATVAPTYNTSAGGYYNQPYLSFRKTPNTQYMDADEVPITFENGMTFVTVVRFLDFVKSGNFGNFVYVGAFLSMTFADQSLGFEVFLSNRGYDYAGPQLCVGRGIQQDGGLQAWNAANNAICTGDQYACAGGCIPLNEWLTVTFTYGGNSNQLHTLKVTYQLPSGVEVVVASKSAFVTGGLQSTPTMAQTLSRINSPTYFCQNSGSCSGTFDASKYALGYSTNLGCSGAGQYKISDIVSGGCSRPDFDLAGLYLMQTIASAADIAVIIQAIQNGHQLAYDKTECLCNAGFEGTGRSTCTSCVAGKYKSETASVPCTACPTNTFATAVQAVSVAQCSSCPQNSVSVPGETICFCAAGFTGPDGGPCEPCAAGTFKNWRNSSACPLCPANSDSVAGTSLCPCNLGYLGPLGGPCVACAAGKYKDTNGTSDITTLGILTTTACLRFVALTTKPSFASVSTMSNAAVGSAILPTYNALGGPNGKGHVSFDRSKNQYLDAGTRTFNIATNGGFTIVAVVRFTSSLSSWERIVDLASGPNQNDLLLARAGDSTNLQVDLRNGNVITASTRSAVVITQNSWLTVVVSYRASTKVCSLTVNGVVSTTTGSTAITDRTVSESWIGKSHFGEPFLNADIAGVFVLDEFLSTNSTTAIANAILQGGLTSEACNGLTPACTTCPANSYEPDVAAPAVTNCTCNTGFEGGLGGPCTACALGMYKDNNQSVACLPCPVDTYIDVQASAYCKACPEFTTSPSNSTSIAACVCKLGYTGAGGALQASVSSSNLARSCGVNSNQACVVSQSTTYASPQYDASNAVDNNLNTFSFTQSGVEQWFRIDFGRSVYVQSISISIKYAGELPYHSNMKVRVGNVDAPTSQNPACYTHSGSLETLGSSTPWTRNIACTTSLEGRYLYYFTPARDGGLLNHLTFTELSPQGFIGGPPGQVACSACAIGKYKDAIGSALCTSCPATTYSAATNATSFDACLACPDNSTSVVGSMSRDYCQCNTGFRHVGDVCEACVPGTFNPRLAQLACSNCTVGTYSLNFAATSNETCASCSATEYSPEGSPICQSCPPYSVAAAGSSKIQDCGCIPGYTGASASLCTKCAPGKYKNITGNWLCESCSANSYSLSAATSLTACFCNAGFTGAYGPLCVGCAIGKYKAGSGSNSSGCTDCPANTYADREGTLVCAACVPASAAAVGSTTVFNCTCNAGYRGPMFEEVTPHANFARSCGPSRTDACTATQSSTFTTLVAVGVYDFVNPARSANDNSASTFSATMLGGSQWWQVDFGRRVTVASVRVLARAIAADSWYIHVGDANSSTSNLICAVVSVNLANADWITVQCSPSLTGRYLFVRNMVASQMAIYELSAQGTEVLVKVRPEFCQECPAGSYKAVPGDSACIACPANSFSVSVAAANFSTCISCAPNSLSPAGSAQCICDVDFSGVPGNCTACASATFKSTSGPSTCEACPANSVIAPSASFVLEPCVCLSGFQPV